MAGEFVSSLRTDDWCHWGWNPCSLTPSLMFLELELVTVPLHWRHWVSPCHWSASMLSPSQAGLGAIRCNKQKLVNHRIRIRVSFLEKLLKDIEDCWKKVFRTWDQILGKSQIRRLPFCRYPLFWSFLVHSVLRMVPLNLSGHYNAHLLLKMRIFVSHYNGKICFGYSSM